MSAFRVTDNFNRADENPLAGSWTTGSAEQAMKIVSNSATFTGASDASAYWNLETWSADQYSQAKLSVSGATIDSGPALTVRQSTSALTWYRVSISTNATNVTLWRAVGGTYTNIWQRTATFTNGDTVRLEVKGTTLRVFINGVQVGADATDTVISTGKPGIGWSAPGTTATIDDWEAGDLGAEPRFPYTSPISFSGPLNVRRSSTWDFYELDIPAADVSVSAGLADVSVVAAASNISLLANAGTTSVSVAANNPTATLQPNAGTTSATVVSNDAALSSQANAGIATVGVVANSATNTLQPNAGATAASVVSNAPATGVAPNTDAVTAGAVANASTSSVAANAGQAVVSVGTFDASAVGLEQQAGFKVGPSPIPFGLNGLVRSTWDYWLADSQMPGGGAVTADAGLASATVTADNASVTDAANADLASVTGVSSPASVGLATAAGTTTAAVVGNASASSLAVNAGTASVTATANNSATGLAANAELVVTAASVFAALAASLEEQAAFKNGPAPIFSPLNTNALDTWNFYSQTTELPISSDATVFAGSASVGVTSNSTAASTQPNAGTSSAATVVNDGGKSVAVNAGFASVSIAALAAQAAGSASAGLTTAIVIANGAGKIVAAPAGFASISATVFGATIPVDGMVSAQLVGVTVSVLAAAGSVVSTHDYTGGAGATDVASHTSSGHTDKTGIGGATDTSNSSSAINRVEGG